MSSQPTQKVTTESRRAVDGAALTDDIGIDREEIEFRQEFTGFGPADAERLEGMADTFDRIADDLVETFYEHLQSYSESVAVLDSSSQPVEALKRSQQEYLLDLGRGEYGPEYFDRRARVGKIHDMLDLGPELYLGAYARYYDGLADAIAADVTAEADDASGAVDRAVTEALERFCSVMKLMNLDQQVAMDTYIHSYNERIEEQLEARGEIQKNVHDEVKSPIDDLRNGSERIVESADEIASLAEESAENTSVVANEIANLSATVEEVASTTDEVASRSAHADELATEGQTSAEGAIDTMSEVTDAADGVADAVEGLHDRLKEIDDVVDVIDDISEQTNLLALNASIEAARAGNAGSGFAVVADEVKSLAEESQAQASRIDEMVTEIQTDALDTVERLEETNEAIDDSTDEVASVLERLEDIAMAVGDASDGVEEVSRAMDEQAASTEEIASMVDELAESSDSLTAEIEEITQANRTQQQDIGEIAHSVDQLADSMVADD